MCFSAFGPTLSDCFPPLISFQVQQPDPVRRGGRTGRLSRPLSRNLQIPGSPVRMRPLQYVFLRGLTLLPPSRSSASACAAATLPTFKNISNLSSSSAEPMMIADCATRVENDNLAVRKGVCPSMRYGCLSDFHGVVEPDKSGIVLKMCHSARIVSIVCWLQDTPVNLSKTGFLSKLAAGQRLPGEWEDPQGVTGK